MAEAELRGIANFEEIFLEESQNTVTHSGQKCEDGGEMNEQDDSVSSVLQTENGDVLPIYAVNMDISETIGSLKLRAAEILQLDLQDYPVFVLSEKEYGDDETLQEQCGTSSGDVQIQFTIRTDANSRGYIDIMDVLKPNEGESTAPIFQSTSSSSTETKSSGSDGKAKKVSKAMRWIVCPTFKELQRVLKIPSDPQEWAASHVRHWLSWAVYQFGLKGINVNDSCWNHTGKELFALGQMEFQKLVPEDPGDLFYMHFELLRRTNVVAVVCDPNSLVPKPSPPKSSSRVSFMKVDPSQGKTVNKIFKDATGGGEGTSGTSHSNSGSGTQQQIQLWQFLLELLTTPKLYPIISWYGDDGEFRLHHPEVVANLWGQRKNKTNMNYEKLSRALRYYYEGDMISKVYGKRFVYRFVLDLKNVIGYSAEELKRQVEECHTRDGSNLDLSPSVIMQVI